HVATRRRVVIDHQAAIGRATNDQRIVDRHPAPVGVNYEKSPKHLILLMDTSRHCTELAEGSEMGGQETQPMRHPERSQGHQGRQFQHFLPSLSSLLSL